MFAVRVRGLLFFVDAAGAAPAHSAGRGDASKVPNTQIRLANPYTINHPYTFTMTRLQNFISGILNPVKAKRCPTVPTSTPFIMPK